MPGFGDFVKNAFSGAGNGLLTGVSKVISNFVADPAQKLQINEQLQELIAKHQESMAAIAEQQYEAQLKDTDSARQMEIAALKQDNWFAKNYIHILASFVSIVWGGLTMFLLLNMLNLLKSDPTVNMTAVLGVYSGLSGIEGIIMNFYFGSSKSSQSKDETISYIAKQP